MFELKSTEQLSREKMTFGFKDDIKNLVNKQLNVR